MEPDIISQTAEPMTSEQRMEWFRFCASQANEKGATFHRFSLHPDIPDLALHEAWKMQPNDQGEPRWQMIFPI